MDNFVHYSFRLAFSSRHAKEMERSGLQQWLAAQLNSIPDKKVPEFLLAAPKTIEQVRDIRKETEENKKIFRKEEAARLWKLQYWWLMRMYSDAQPLREKMTLFLHNHFVSSYQKVKISYLMYAQNQLFRENAFGNFKTLTKKVLRDNAMLIYLDNHQNKVKTPNENLGRELLELFTLGIGNYSESDIKAAAAALAGLAPGDQGGEYHEKWKDNSVKTLFGQSGNFDADSLVDIIFSRPQMGKLLAEKLIRYFITDDPKPKLIEKYQLMLVKENFELKPVLMSLLNEPSFLDLQGTKIKDPVSFFLATAFYLNLQEIPPLIAISFIRQQQMELFNPPNVKGWEGGRAWLDVQKLIQRNAICQSLCRGEFPIKSIKSRPGIDDRFEMSRQFGSFVPKFNWNPELKNNKEIIAFVLSRLIFDKADHLKIQMEEIMKYDFDPSLPGAEAAVMRLVEFCMQSPDYQIS